MTLGRHDHNLIRYQDAVAREPHPVDPGRRSRAPFGNVTILPGAWVLLGVTVLLLGVTTWQHRRAIV